MDFKPIYSFFVGIDSDGTAFDSMTVKHKKVFAPAFLELWDFSNYTDTFIAIWEDVNLTSKDRGCNRFIALCKAFEALEAQGIKLYDYSSLQQFIQNGGSLSNKGLISYMETHPNPFLQAVYTWSLRSDELFALHNEGEPPFDNVLDALKMIAPKADVVVISSASYASIKKDWTEAGLMDYVSLACGQESGTKIQQLKSTSEGRYAENHVLMIGDAPGDLEAAKATGSLFYPIIPNEEAACWKRLIEEGFAKFLDGTYAGAYEDTLIKGFYKALKIE